MENKRRIDILDSFRFLAILFVMLFHYYSRWCPPIEEKNYYPYLNSYNYFKFGYLGVEFFFILSGFMIFYSLSGARNIRSFWIKKMIRLFPPLFMCSIITFIFFRLYDFEDIIGVSHSFKNLLVSLTFVSPYIVNHLFDIHVNYINGSYWFLWPEIQFYFIASLIFYIKPKHFIRNYSIFSFILSLTNYLLMRITANIYTTNRLNIHISDYYLNQYKFWNENFNFLKFNMFFLIGIFLFILYENRNKISTKIFLGIIILIESWLESYLWSSTEKWIILAIIVFMLVFIYSPAYLQWIAFLPITSVGISSYSLYLIHEHIGVLIINKYANSLGQYNYLFPVLLIILFMYLCYLCYKYVEKPITNYLKLRLLSENKK